MLHPYIISIISTKFGDTYVPLKHSFMPSLLSHKKNNEENNFVVEINQIQRDVPFINAVSPLQRKGVFQYPNHSLHWNLLEL